MKKVVTKATVKFSGKLKRGVALSKNNKSWKASKNTHRAISSQPKKMNGTIFPLKVSTVNSASVKRVNTFNAEMFALDEEEQVQEWQQGMESDLEEASSSEDDKHNDDAPTTELLVATCNGEAGETEFLHALTDSGTSRSLGARSVAE